MSEKPLPSQTPVLIVGAGPAGLAAALALGRAGVDAVLVEAKDRIGHPLRCGEVVPTNIFETMGIEPRVGWVRWLLPAMGHLVLNRPRMEEELASMVRDLGVRVLVGASLVALLPFDGEGRQAVIQYEGKRLLLQAGCVIAADGVASMTARLAGLSTRIPLERAICYVGKVIMGATPANEDSAFLQPLPPPHPYPPYYFWVIPNGNGRLNVGLGVMGVDGSRARFLLESMIARNEAFSGGRSVQAFCGLMPFQRPLDPPLADGLLVAGTAARLSDSYGGGILLAAKSGRAAAETCLELGGASAGASALSGYRERISPLVQMLEKGLKELEERNASSFQKQQ